VHTWRTRAQARQRAIGVCVCVCVCVCEFLLKTLCNTRTQHYPLQHKLQHTLQTHTATLHVCKTYLYCGRKYWYNRLSIIQIFILSKCFWYSGETSLMACLEISFNFWVHPTTPSPVASVCLIYSFINSFIH